MAWPLVKELFYDFLYFMGQEFLDRQYHTYFSVFIISLNTYREPHLALTLITKFERHIITDEGLDTDLYPHTDDLFSRLVSDRLHRML